MFHHSKNWDHLGWMLCHIPMHHISCVLELELKMAGTFIACSCSADDGDCPPTYRSTHNMFHHSKNWDHLGWMLWHSPMLHISCVLELELKMAVTFIACSCSADDGDCPPPYRCTHHMFHHSKNWDHLGWMLRHSPIHHMSCVLE